MTRLLNMYVMIVIVVRTTNAAKILVMSMHGSSSHIGSMQPYITRLAEAGHSVTVLETNGRKEAKDFGSGIKTEHIYIPDNTDEKKAYSEIWWRSSPTGILVTSLYYVIGNKALKKYLELEPKIFWRVANSSWDLIVVDELFTVHGYGIATLQKLQHRTPYIIFSPSLMFFTNYVVSSLGRCVVCRVHLSLSSTTDVDYQPAVFAHRVRNAMEHITEYIGLGYFVQWFGMPLLRQIGVSDFTWHRYFHDASAILSDAMINIGHPTAEGTEMTNVGSVCATPFGTLSNDVDNFLNDPLSKGTIYVAFGSHVNWITSPTLLKAAFLDALAELTDYRIIFAYNAPVGNMPRHIKVFQFAPQKEILNHNRTKLFISHGGLKSLKESICAGVPLVLMPIFAEQAHNTFLARQLGIAETLNKVQVTKEIVISQLKKVLNDSKYVDNVRKVKRLFLDRVIPAMDHSVFITERILRHHPKQIYFKRKGINLMWIQHLYIDLAILLFCALFIVNY